MEQNKGLVIDFFKSFKCDVNEKNDLIFISKIPERLQKTLGVSEKIELNKNNLSPDLIRKIKECLKNNPSRTLLRIDFEFPSNINEKIKLKNCVMSKIEKRHENNYFSRFSFLTTFRFHNNVEQVLNEIFVHEEKIVSGDLTSYNIQEGKIEDVSTEHLSKDYDVAKIKLKDLLNKKISLITNKLGEELSIETKRVEEHFGKILNEINANKDRFLERIKEAEAQKDDSKVKRLKEEFEKNNFEREMEKINREIGSVISNEKNKYSLDIDNKLINTTIIYYPVFRITITLEESGFKKPLEIIYNPLTEQINNFVCDSCKTNLERINVCHGGHICCDSCLHLCSECGKRFCRMCFAGICSSCGKLICKNCVKKCIDCKKIFCKSCMRKSDATGIEKCLNCVSYCPICSQIVEKKFLVRGSDGRMICRKCNEKNVKR